MSENAAAIPTYGVYALRVIKMAGLEKMILSLSTGLNSWVGENGVKISAGE